MEQTNVAKVLYKLHNVLNFLKDETGDKDTNTIREQAQGLIEQLEKDPECITDELVDTLVKNSEEQVIDFFKTKYDATVFIKKIDDKDH